MPVIQSWFLTNLYFEIKWRLHRAPCAHLRVSSAVQVDAVPPRLLSFSQSVLGGPICFSSFPFYYGQPVRGACSIFLGFISLRFIVDWMKMSSFIYWYDNHSLRACCNPGAVALWAVSQWVTSWFCPSSVPSPQSWRCCVHTQCLLTLTFTLSSLVFKFS